MCLSGGGDKPEESEAKLALAETAAVNLKKYGELFVPLENMYIDKAMGSFDDANYGDLMGQASTRASGVYETGVADARNAAFGRGLDPTSGAFTGESDALRTAQARAMGETASDAGLFQTDRGYNRLANVVKMGQGLAGEVQDSYMDLGKNQLSALETQAEKDFSKSASLQNLAGTAAGVGVGYGLNRNRGMYS